MKTTFTYPLPEENYVSGISTTRKGTYNYEGPDELIFEINDAGNIVDIDPDYEIFNPDKVSASGMFGVIIQSTLLINSFNAEIA